MRECKVICDKCHLEVITGDYPYTPAKDGWKDIKIELSQYNHKVFVLCPKCLKEMGFLDEKENMKKISDRSVQEKVFDLFCEITQMVVEENGGN